MFATRVNSNKETISEQEVRELIVKDLKEWGFEFVKNEDHEAFWKEAVKEAVARSKRDKSAVSSQRPFSHDVELSKGNVAAVRQVLLNELESAKDFIFLDAEDSLGFHYKPLFHWEDRRTQEVTLRRNGAAQNYTMEELDPLKRFKVVEYSTKDWFRKIWKMPDSLGGYVFEALVARHMIDNMPCKSCGCRNQFHWNGGITDTGSWADVVCMNCLASYEIKSIKSDSTFEKKIKYNNFNGGSFRKFYKNPAQYQARFLVLVRREESLDYFAHRVSVAEIKKVKPRLVPNCFDVSRTLKIRLKSTVEIDMESLEKSWFYVKPFPDQEAIAKEVFNDFYGDGAW